MILLLRIRHQDLLRHQQCLAVVASTRILISGHPPLKALKEGMRDGPKIGEGEGGVVEGEGEGGAVEGEEDKLRTEMLRCRCKEYTVVMDEEL